MNKFIRSITVIGASAALTFAGAGAATAQTSLSDLERLSSQFLNPDAAAERELYNAGIDYGRDSTTKINPTENHAARNANKGDPGWGHIGWGVDRKEYTTASHRFMVFRVNKNNQQALVDYLYGNTRSGQHGEDFGVHVSTSNNRYYVAVAFTR